MIEKKMKKHLGKFNISYENALKHRKSEIIGKCEK